VIFRAMDSFAVIPRFSPSQVLNLTTMMSSMRRKSVTHEAPTWRATRQVRTSRARSPGQPEADVVLIHEAATRPFVGAVISRAIDEAGRPAPQSCDTGHRYHQVVTERKVKPRRSGAVASAQTPQGSVRRSLDAHRRAAREGRSDFTIEQRWRNGRTDGGYIEGRSCKHELYDQPEALSAKKPAPAPCRPTSDRKRVRTFTLRRGDQLMICGIRVPS